MGITTTLLINQDFSSFEELSAKAKSWNIDFRQLNTEHFKSNFFQAKIGSILVSSATFGCHVEQRGETPPEMRTFAVLSKSCPDIYWFGHHVNNDDLLIFPSHGEIECFSRVGFEVNTISIPESLLRNVFELKGVDNINKIITAEEIVKKTSVKNINQLRNLLQQLKIYLQRNNVNIEEDYLLDNQIFYNEIQNQILRAIFNIMTDSCYQNSQSFYKLSRKNSISKLQTLIEYIKVNDGELLHVDKLCHVAQISERSIQYLFKRELGMSPTAYIKGHRLYKAHKKLWKYDQSNINIRDVANEFGFWHMGQFATDYFKLFGELPSKTLRKNSKSHTLLKK